MKMQRSMLMAFGFLAAASLAQTNPSQPVPVTVDNFVRAESDKYFADLVKESGGLARFNHRREVAPLDNQTVIRLNRDTLYSSAIVDLDAGPVRITLPDAGGRFRSLMIVNQDHYVQAVSYASGPHEYTRERIGTRYMLAGVRTLVDPNDPQDVKKVHALQDAMKIEQKGGGQWQAPAWDAASQKKVRDALLTLATTMPDFTGAFGTKEQVDPVRHLLGSAAAWGGNPAKDAIYLNVVPAKNDGKTVHRLSVKDVPVDGFWSISLYNEKGYYEKNPLNAYTVNNITAQRAADGSVAVQFGGCDGKVPNCLPIMKGWNYTVRLYRPRAEILNGKWKFPEPQPA